MQIGRNWGSMSRIIILAFTSLVLSFSAKAGTNYLWGTEFSGKSDKELIRLVKATHKMVLRFEASYPLEHRRMFSMRQWFERAIVSEAHASTRKEGDLCFHGLYLSTFRGGKCSSPWRSGKNEVLSKLGEVYPKKSKCSIGQFQCPSDLAYAGPNKVYCVDGALATRSQKCVEKVTKNMGVMIEKLKSDEKYAAAFSGRINIMVDMCADSQQRIGACDQLINYVNHFQSSDEKLYKSIVKNHAKFKASSATDVEATIAAKPVKKNSMGQDIDPKVLADPNYKPPSGPSEETYNAKPKTSKVELPPAGDISDEQPRNACHKGDPRTPKKTYTNFTTYHDPRAAQGDCLPPVSDGQVSQILRKNGVTVSGGNKQDRKSLARIYNMMNILSGGNLRYRGYKNSRHRFKASRGSSYNGTVNVGSNARRRSGLSAKGLNCHGKLPVLGGHHNHIGIAHELAHKMGHTPVGHRGLGNTFYSSYSKAMGSRRGSCRVSSYGWGAKGKRRITPSNEVFAEVLAAYITNPDILLTRGKGCRKAYGFFQKVFGETKVRTCAQRYALGGKGSSGNRFLAGQKSQRRGSR